MQLTTRSLPIEPVVASAEANEPAKALYFALSEPHLDERTRRRAEDYLVTQLERAAALPCDLPEDPQGLIDWIERHTAEVGQQYQAYLQSRAAGAPRRYFRNKSHALHFLQGVAPTKLVDGAWLYGLLQHWNDPRFTALIQTYLEELGDGLPEKNHVVLYRKLLASQGCEDWQSLDDEHFVQGAIQLSLAEHAEHFLPEVIGFNLGYEQLPLHLLITSYELTELGIDPYYFTLHVTVDNASSGHARKAVQGVHAAWPQVGDSKAFYRRVANGYRLNDLGASTLSVIANFDLDREVLKVFEKKSAVGQFVHSDYCRFAGRTVNQLLANPALIPEFLQTLEQRGWIKRNEDPRNSRFWGLIQGEQAEMFGVFSAQEQQLIHDWIAGDWSASGTASEGPSVTSAPGRHVLEGRRQLLRRRAGLPLGEPGPAAPTADSDFDQELRDLERQLASLPTRDAKMALLLPLLAPTRHHTLPGLMATRVFAELFS
ncbi:iron-containing redox enzyme family protein [Stutzerimonas nosocomialis]|uniref:iron-containing redox enzyme family protein n=1 Tax=Stutzerimonas nosocomialis TaxID=1056496 RepID=UPI001108481F|nr:iron-containing redox enzyme family protein [Stutzerimonas nosocomialis]TLX59160.1 iron-containing redox enzyme family protein [Stutzerimonas nosocomialis]